MFAYELLFRASFGTDVEAPPGHDKRSMLADAVLAMGLDTMTHGRPAFVTVSRDSLLEGIPTLLLAEHVIVALTEDSFGDSDIVEACRVLKRAGYRIALNDFVFSDQTVELIRFADYLKIDFTALSDPAVRAATMEQLGPVHGQLVAGNIETAEQLELAAQEGFAYFQGYFFGQTVMRQAREIPATQAACLQLMHRLNKANLTLAELEDIVKHDAMLTYRLLRTVKSAATVLPASAPAVQSIRLALTLLGVKTVQRWASIWAMAALAEPGRHEQAELVAMAVIRARCCELLERPRHDDGFLLGLCSLLDVILRQPVETVIGLLPLADDIREALGGEQNARRELLDCVIAYERGQWEDCQRLATRAGVDPAMLPIAYRDALSWTRGLDGTAA